MNKKDLSFSEMFNLQDEQFEKHDWWDRRIPENGQKKLLWMFEELGEVISLIKKKGSDGILNDSEIRKDFIEECSDVIMYFNDVLKSYDITPEEISNAYYKKYEKNLNRDFSNYTKNKN